MGHPDFAITLAICVAIVITTTFVTYSEGAPRAFFVFGDSLVDNGNNNFLATTARADSPPYGVDFPTHRPTGRFSNGLNIADLISKQLGADLTLPYLDPALDGDKLLVGANFASAGIGILNDTGIQFVNILRIYDQLNLFQQYQQRVSGLIGAEQTKRLVNGALVLITLGGNDFVNNYFLTPISVRQLEYNIQDYSRIVINEYTKILTRLHDLGARRVLVTGTGPLGCVPAELALWSSNGECANELQQATKIFNPLLIQMVTRLNQQLSSDIFVAVNAMELQNDFINKPKEFGFVTSKTACCGQGPYNGLGLCTTASNLCTNRDEYAFWDAFHPTEKDMLKPEMVMGWDDCGVVGEFKVMRDGRDAGQIKHYPPCPTPPIVIPNRTYTFYVP